LGGHIRRQDAQNGMPGNRHLQGTACDASSCWHDLGELSLVAFDAQTPWHTAKVKIEFYRFSRLPSRSSPIEAQIPFTVQEDSMSYKHHWISSLGRLFG
jgi:hypothetical protein